MKQQTLPTALEWLWKGYPATPLAAEGLLPPTPQRRLPVRPPGR